MTDAEQILEYIKKNCPLVCRMKQQLTIGQAEGLLGLYPLRDIEDQLDKMNNRPYIADKFASVFFTCKSWFEQDIKRGYYKLEVRGQGLGVREKLNEKEIFLSKYPRGTKIRINNNPYEVEDNNFLWNTETAEILPITAAIHINNIKREV